MLSGRGRAGRRARAPAPGPPTAESVAALAAERRQLNVQQHPLRQDATYSREQNYYREWVDNKRGEGIIPTGTRYITGENVDLYFTEKVVNRMITPQSAKRICYALDRLAFREYAGETTAFECKTRPVVQQSLKLQQDKYYQHLREQSSMHDPIGKLRTDMLTPDEKSTFINIVLGNNKPNWSPLCLSFTGCEQLMTCYHSLNQVRLCDLHHNNTHGPNETGPYDTEMLGVAYQPGIHKEVQTSKRVLGSWRHFDWEQCFTGHVAMSLFYRLGSGSLQLDFTRRNAREKPGWWKELLIPEWGDTTVAGNSYEVIFGEGVMQWEKCVHMRKAATEYSSSRGRLSSVKIASMTKHSLAGMNVLEKSYLTELDMDVLSCMSRTEVENYFVGRTRLPVEDMFPGIDLTKRVFLHYEDYVEQVNGPNADESRAARQFVLQLMPFLARVVVQDGFFLGR